MPEFFAFDINSLVKQVRYNIINIKQALTFENPLSNKKVK